MSRTAVVIVCSTRAAAGSYPDKTGPVLVRWLAGQGFEVGPPVVVSDGPDVLMALRGALTADLVITSGGTGLTPTDRTPEATAALLDYQIPGLAQALRDEGVEKVPTAVLSRGLVGVTGRTLVVNLPGSTGGVADGMAVLDRVLDHALDQIQGGDHPLAPGQPRPGRVARAGVSESTIAVSEHAAAVDDPAAGATVTFSGVVRDHDGGRSVTGLEYQVHPSASEVIAQVAAEVAGRTGVIAVAVTHRHGVLRVGDVALAVAVSAAHRREAFRACADLVDEVKKRLPIWKRQVFADGTDEWVGSA